MSVGVGYVERDGVEYVTTPEAVRRLAPDVNTATLQDWVRRGLLTPAGRIPGRSHLFCWADVLAAEQRTHDERRGRPRLHEIDSQSTISEQMPPMDRA